MNNSHYNSSFLITVAIYTLLALLYLAFIDEVEPFKKINPKPPVIKIALIAPVIKKKIKKVEPKVEKPKPKKKKKIIKKKKVVKKKKIKKRVVKHKKIKHKKVKHKKIIHPKPKPKIIPKRVVEEEIYYPPPPVIQEIIPEPIVQEPIYYEPPAPIYKEIAPPIAPPQEVYHQQQPQPVAPIVQSSPPSRQEYIINDPLPAHTTARKSNLDNEKRAFKRETRNIINSNKRYPTMAKRRHIQGRVHVTFDILSSGEITNIQTSGASSILQKSARKSVIQSSPLNIPPVLQSQFPMNSVSINIDFQLQ